MTNGTNSIFGETPVSERKEQPKYHMYLQEKQFETGLTADEIRRALDMLKPGEELIPIDIHDGMTGCTAMGFVTYSLYDTIEWRTYPIKELATEKLFRTDSRVSDVFIEKLAGFDVYLCR